MSASTEFEEPQGVQHSPSAAAPPNCLFTNEGSVVASNSSWKEAFGATGNRLNRLAGNSWHELVGVIESGGGALGYDIITLYPSEPFEWLPSDATCQILCVLSVWDHIHFARLLPVLHNGKDINAAFGRPLANSVTEQLSSNHSTEFASPTNGAEPAAGPVRFTARERELVALLARGIDAKAASDLMGISASTVYVHLRNAKNKIGTRTTAGVVAYAVTEGLIRV